MGQLIFVDDSGDPGFKIKNGASRMFVIACVVFDSLYTAEFASAGIKVLKEKLGWKQIREFKFHRATEEQKEAFFRDIKKYDFYVRAVVVDKTKIVEPQLKRSDSFYNYIITQVLQRFREMNNAYIKLDGSGSRDFRRRSTSNLRKTLNKDNQYKVVNFKLEDSRDDVLIQLADMVAGCIRAKYDPDKKIKHNYLRYIKSKIVDIWEYE